MIPDLAYTSRDIYVSNQVRSKPTYLSGLGIISLYTRGFCHLVNTLTFTRSIIRTVILTKLTSTLGESLSYVHLAGLLFSPLSGVLKSGTPHDLTSGQSARRLTT